MSVRARSFEFAVSMDRAWTVTSDRGGGSLGRDAAWTPEHLVLAGLCRCTLTALEFHAGRSALTVTSSGDARGVVTRRAEDGRFAFVEIDAGFEVVLDPPPERAVVLELLEKAERDCFVGASLTVKPVYRWTVNGEAVA